MYELNNSGLNLRLKEPKWIEARDKAKREGKKSFKFEGKKYSTKMPYMPNDGQFDEYGINDELIENQLPFGLSERITENIYPQGISLGTKHRPWSSILKAVLTNTKEDNEYAKYGWDMDKEDSQRQSQYDAFRMSLGLPQKYGKWQASSYEVSDKSLSQFKRYFKKGKTTYQAKDAERVIEYIEGDRAESISNLNIDQPKLTGDRARNGYGTSTVVLRGKLEHFEGSESGPNGYWSAWNYDAPSKDSYLEVIDVNDYAPGDYQGGLLDASYNSKLHKAAFQPINRLIEKKASFPVYERQYLDNRPDPQPITLDSLIQTSVSIRNDN